MTAGRPVADYLQDELLDGLHEDDRAFLVATSVLDLLHADLCDALLDRRDSHMVLRRLASSENLLIAELDDTGTWYRYHRLLRDLLLAELRATNAGAEPELHRRAGTWLRTRGFADEAVRQLLAAGARDAAATLVVSEIGHLVLEGRVATLEHWIACFAVEEIRADPGLTIVAAFGAALSGRYADVEHWLTCLRDVDPHTTLPDGTTVETGRAAVEMLTGLGGTKATAAAADLLVDLGPDGTPWWASARVIGTVARYAGGQLDDADGAFAAVATDTASAPSAHAVALAQRAIVLLRSHRAADGHRIVRDALTVARDNGLDRYPVLVMVRAAAALDASMRGDPRATADEADVAEELLGLVAAGPRTRIECRLVVAEAALRADDVDRAAASLRLATVDLDVEPDAIEFTEWAADLGRRLAGRARAGNVVLTAAERRLLEQLPTHLSLGEIAARLYVSRNTVKTQSIAVYRKLGVGSRSEAVASARELGLLDN